MNRYLIVNADDFGLSTGVNEGIIFAHEQGIVTSASVMVRWPAAVHATMYGRANPDFSLGLHIDLGEWIYQNDSWIPLYEVVPTNDGSAVAVEVGNQLNEFRRLMGRDPTHLDSHQHVHRHEPLRTILSKLADDLNIPLRHFSPIVRYCGDFYGQTGKGQSYPETIGVSHLASILIKLPAGFTELACHPGYVHDLNSAYGYERFVELQTLCHAQIQATISSTQIQLCSFADIGLIVTGQSNQEEG